MNSLILNCGGRNTMGVSLNPRRVNSGERDWGADLAAIALRQWPLLNAIMGDDDLDEPLSQGTALLCCGLGLLSLEVYLSLGGKQHIEEVERAAALFSLVSKIDDQRVDARNFHAGLDKDDVQVRAELYLHATLDSIEAGLPLHDEPRLRLAAALGSTLQDLAGGSSRLERFSQLLDLGVELQVATTTGFTSPPSEVPMDTIEVLTADTPLAWFAAILSIGTLPEDAERGLSSAETEALRAWACYLQWADNLADLEKDLEQGHTSCYLGRSLWEQHPKEYEDAVEKGDWAAVYHLLAEEDLDRSLLPDQEHLEELGEALAELGGLQDLFAWIHRFLITRYVEHRFCARSHRDEEFAAYHGALPAWYPGAATTAKD